MLGKISDASITPKKISFYGGIITFQNTKNVRFMM